MRSIKKWVPLWLKCPASIFLREIGRVPVRILYSHIYLGFIESKNSTEKAKKKAYEIVKKKTYKYLEMRYKELAESFVEKSTLGIEEYNATIWIFWWQGEQNAPEIIKHCIASVRRNAGEHPVKIINSQNYTQFVDVPKHIEEKFEKGIISITHFSDYYRMALLESCGGLWLDASIFVKMDINDQYFATPLFTIRNPGKDKDNISCWEWTVGVIGGRKHNTLFRAVRKLLECYWKDHNITIDYFIFDYMIKLVYENCSFLRKTIQSIPDNNSHFYYLQNNANKAYIKSEYIDELCSDTIFYKISWKGNYLLATQEEKTTIYSKWLNICSKLETAKGGE